MASEARMALSRPARLATATQASKSRPGVPAFLQKLYEMLSDPHSQDLIRWADTADSFFVLDHERFSREILPRWFKHQNFASFVRQLNMYGFHKIPHLQQGVLRSDTGETEYWNFAHENFRRDQPDLLCLIHRKKGNIQQQPGVATILGPEEGILDVRDPNTPQSTAVPISPHGITNPGPGSGQVLDMNSILQGIATIKKHQTTISEELQQLKQSNQLLWQESMAVRERLQKNEDTVQRIVKFLAGVFGNRRAEGAHSEHTHTGHNDHEGEGRAQGRNERAVVPAQRRSDGSSGASADARGRRPRLMIEGSKDTAGKGMNNVGIVEVGEDDADDVVDITVEDDDDETMANSDTGRPRSSYDNIYAVETPLSVPSPSLSIAQPDVSLNQSIVTDPNPNLGSSSPELNDAIMHESSANENASTNSTSTVNDRAIAPSHHTVPSPPPLQLQSTLNNLSSLTPEQLSLLLSFLSQLDVSSSSSIDPNLGFPSNPDNVDVNQLNTFAHSPPNFDFSSLSNLGSPNLPGFSSGLGAGTGFLPLLTGSSASGTTSTPTSPGLTTNPEHLLTLEPDVANSAVLPRLERHWRDVQDVDKDVMESENQIYQLIDSLGPFLIGAAGLTGLGPGPTTQMNGGSTITPNMNETMKHVNVSNASSTKVNGTVGGDKGNNVDDADTDISSLDPTHLSIPSGLENTDFDFDSFFPHNSSTSSTNPSFSVDAAHTSPSTIDDLTAQASDIDSARDINFVMDDISGINGYNDLNAGAETISFLNNEASPASTSTVTPGSPVQSTKIKTSSTPTMNSNAGKISRKRKPDMMGMEELEGALLGAAKEGSALAPDGETTGLKVKRRKD